MVSFIDDNFTLAEGFLKRDYTEIGNNIRKEKEKLTIYEEIDDLLVGCMVTKNIPLSNFVSLICYINIGEHIMFRDGHVVFEVKKKFKNMVDKFCNMI